MTKTKSKPTIYYVRESLVQSVLADVTSFGFILSIFFANRYLLNNSWYIYIFGIILFFIVSLNKGNQKLHKFHTNEELIKYLQSTPDHD